MSLEYQRDNNQALSMQLHFSNVEEKTRFVDDFLIWRELKGCLPVPAKPKKASSSQVLHELAHLLWTNQRARPYKDVLKETSILFKYFKMFLVDQNESLLHLLLDDDGGQARFFAEPDHPPEREEELGEIGTDEAHRIGGEGPV